MEYLGRKGRLTGLLRLVGTLPPDEKPRLRPGRQRPQGRTDGAARREADDACRRGAAGASGRRCRGRHPARHAAPLGGAAPADAPDAGRQGRADRHGLLVRRVARHRRLPLQLRDAQLPARPPRLRRADVVLRGRPAPAAHPDHGVPGARHGARRSRRSAPRPSASATAMRPWTPPTRTRSTR